MASALNPSTTFFLYSGFKSGIGVHGWGPKSGIGVHGWGPAGAPKVVLGFMAGALLGAPRPKPEYQKSGFRVHKKLRTQVWGVVFGFIAGAKKFCTQTFFFLYSGIGV